MPPADWFETRVAPNAEALHAGNGCYPEEAKALDDFFRSVTANPQDAAKRITRPVMNEPNPQQNLYRLWALLTEALVEVSTEERGKTLDLLAAIQALPPRTTGSSSKSDIEWSKMVGFASMWDTMNKLHLHGPARWEREFDTTFSKEKKHEFQQIFASVGAAEAEMFVRGFSFVHASSGFKVLNLVRSDRRGLDIFLSEVYAWLRVAGTKLKWEIEQASSSESTEWRTGGGATADHWATWKRSLLELSKQGSRLSEDGRKLALQCYELM